MDLIAEISKEKLVIMVTHNPEIAQEYSTRIVKLKDGRILVVEYNGAPGPMTDYSADPETLCKMNEEFYAKFLETINKMC